MQNGSSDGKSDMGLQVKSPKGKTRRVGRAPLKSNEKMWVTATICLILFLVFSLQALILLPYFLYQLPYSNSEVVWTIVKILGPFNMGAALILTNYYRCVTMDAGSVPLEWEPPAAIMSSTSEPARYCKPCKALKPPRTHHCRTCKQCVLRMDHHCPWIANCVGQYNYASFIRFLAAVDVTCAAHLTLCTLRTADYWWIREGGSWRPPNTMTMTLLVLNYGFCLPTFFLVGAFSIYHFWCMCTNTTTIEGWERDKVETMIRKKRIEEIDYPFDLGIIRNVQSVLGASPLSWCTPSKTRGDGLRFEVAEGIDEHEQYYWPPKDPLRTARDEKRKKKKKGEFLPESGPFTYGNNGFNPALKPSNSSSSRDNRVSAYPPWHPDFNKRRGEDEDEEEEEEDAAQSAGLDTGEGCLPPGTIPGTGPPAQNGIEHKRVREEDDDESSDSSSDEEGEETAKTMTASRVRRGSEGYEVRPKRYDVAFAAQEEDQYDDDDNDEADQYGYDEYGDEEEQEKQWDWQQRQEEEEKLRLMLEEEMRKTGATISHDPPPDWEMPDQSSSASSSSTILLPSQVMRRRHQWLEYNQRQINDENTSKLGTATASL